MAELSVQPKQQRPWWIWLLLAVVALAILFFLLRGCNNSGKDTANAADSTVATTTPAGASGADANWNDVDFNAPRASYDEISDSNINVRGTDNYAIYGLGENILFSSDNSAIRNEAQTNLKQIAASLEKRYKDGDIRVYGYTDAEGSAGYNKQLAEQRAEAVRNWLIKNGNIAEGKITLHPVGESQPVASNATEAGRQQNRRVEIVVKRAR